MMKEKLIAKIIENTNPYHGMEDDFEGLKELPIEELEKIANELTKDDK